VEARARFRAAFYPLLPVTFLSAVVAYELAVNAEEILPWLRAPDG
jgi:hypothetical protein